MQLYQALITLDGWTFLAQICNLMIQLVIFKKLLLNPVKKVIAERKAKADSQIADAQKLRTEAEAMKAEYEAKLKEVDKEVEAILADARKRALAREEQIIEEAKTEAAHIIERAHNEVLLEKKGAADDMKKEMIALASALAGKVVSASIDTDIQASLVDETLREMGDDTWQN